MTKIVWIFVILALLKKKKKKKTHASTSVLYHYFYFFKPAKLWNSSVLSVFPRHVHALFFPWSQLVCLLYSRKPVGNRANYINSFPPSSPLFLGTVYSQFNNHFFFFFFNLYRKFKKKQVCFVVFCFVSIFVLF